MFNKNSSPMSQTLSILPMRLSSMSSINGMNNIALTLLVDIPNLCILIVVISCR